MTSKTDSLVLDAAEYISCLSPENQQNLLEILLKKSAASHTSPPHSESSSWPRIVSLIRTLSSQSTDKTSVRSPQMSPRALSPTFSDTDQQLSPDQTLFSSKTPSGVPEHLKYVEVNDFVSIRPSAQFQPVFEQFKELQRNVDVSVFFSEVILSNSDIGDDYGILPSSNGDLIQIIESHIMSILILSPSVILQPNSQPSLRKFSSQPTATKQKQPTYPEISSSMKILSTLIENLVQIQTTESVKFLREHENFKQSDEVKLKSKKVVDSFCELIDSVKRVCQIADSIETKLDFAKTKMASLISNSLNFARALKSFLEYTCESINSVQYQSRNVRTTKQAVQSRIRGSFMVTVSAQFKHPRGSTESSESEEGILSEKLKQEISAETTTQAPKFVSVKAKNSLKVSTTNTHYQQKGHVREKSGIKVLQRPEALNQQMRIVSTVNEDNSAKSKELEIDDIPVSEVSNQWSQYVEEIGGATKWDETRTEHTKSTSSGSNEDPESPRSASVSKIPLPLRKFSKGSPENLGIAAMKRKFSTDRPTIMTSPEPLSASKEKDLTEFPPLSLRLSEMVEIADNAFFPETKSNSPKSAGSQSLELSFTQDTSVLVKDLSGRYSPNVLGDSPQHSRSNTPSPTPSSNGNQIDSSFVISPASTGFETTIGVELSSNTPSGWSINSDLRGRSKKDDDAHSQGTNGSGNTFIDNNNQKVKFKENNVPMLERVASIDLLKRKRSLSAYDSGKTFESLRIVGKRGVQRIPAFDSHGRRIGILDHGRFSSETESSESEEETPNVTSGIVSIKGNLLHLSEDNKDVLIMEMTTGKLQIVGGTIEKILLRLADENVQDLEYVDTVIQAHTFFISSRDLLENMCARFRIEPPNDPTPEDLEYFKKWRKSIQLKALNVIGRWLKIHFEDFEMDPILGEILDEFLNEVRDSGFKNESQRIRRAAQTQASSIAMKNSITPFPPYLLNSPPPLPVMPEINTTHPFGPPVYMYPPLPRNPILDRVAPFPRFDSPNLIQSSPLLDMDFRDLAKYLTAADHAAFCSISTADFFNKLLEGGEPAKVERNSFNDGEVLPVSAWKGRIDLFTARSNMLRNWVALEICCVTNIKNRRRLIEKFIAVAKVCRDLNNFHTLLFIVSGLLSHPVQRLKKTWEGVNSKGTLQTLEKLLDPSNNMKNYRRALNTAKLPILPFFPVVMKDLTFIAEGIPATTRTDSDMLEELINLDKYRTLVRTMKRYMDMARSQPYQFSHLLLPTLKSVPVMLYGPPEYSYSSMGDIANLKFSDEVLDQMEAGSAVVNDESPASKRDRIQNRVKEQYLDAQASRINSLQLRLEARQEMNARPQLSGTKLTVASLINHNAHNYAGNQNGNTNLQFFGGLSGSASECMAVEKLAFLIENRVAFADDSLVGFWPKGGNAMAAALILAGRVEGEKWG